MNVNNRTPIHKPNWAFKPTPTLAMASPFSWPVLVPYALRAPAPVNLGVRPLFGWSLEASSGRVWRHLAHCSAHHAGMVWLASVASWLINRLASLQAWR